MIVLRTMIPPLMGKRLRLDVSEEFLKDWEKLSYLNRDKYSFQRRSVMADDLYSRCTDSKGEVIVTRTEFALASKSLIDIGFEGEDWEKVEKTSRTYGRYSEQRPEAPEEDLPEEKIRVYGWIATFLLGREREATDWFLEWARIEAATDRYGPRHVLRYACYLFGHDRARVLSPDLRGLIFELFQLMACSKRTLRKAAEAQTLQELEDLARWAAG
ncbi:hypothetical protein EON81_16475 [bacterium]|nr:MAG: hypothetical protein EON81_16475 [bacterium]